MVELGSIIILGILSQWVAWRLRVPAILPLILIGLCVGPLSTLYTIDGLKLIEPTWHEDIHHGLFPGNLLTYFVELSIGIILFEGGMTLKRDEFSAVGNSIIKLITLGALVTFIGGALLAHYIVPLSWPLSFLFSGLIIVTGPTVIAPILRNLPLNKSVANVLKWEGILIDPVGALVAVLVYEFIHSGGGEFTSMALMKLVQIILVGLSMGLFSALALREMLKRDWIPHYLITIFSLAFVLVIFVGSNIVIPDSGLLSVVVAGMILGNIDVPHIKEIEYFKESLSILLISILFILLSANIDIKDLQLLLNWRCALLLASIILVLRPLCVFLSTRNSNLTRNEKLFISWVGPRGIVAAGIASYLGLKLAADDIPGADFITPLVFLIVLGTVVLNATTAGLVAKGLGVLLQKSNGIMIIGANKAARYIGKYLKEFGNNVVLIDSNKNNVAYAKKMGLIAYSANIYNDDLSNVMDLGDVGYVLGMTSSKEVNDFAINKFQKKYGENGIFRIISSAERNDPDTTPQNGLFSSQDDFINLSEVMRDNADFHEEKINNATEYEAILSAVNSTDKTIPLFLKNPAGEIEFITTSKTQPMIADGSTFVYLGKRLPDTIPNLMTQKDEAPVKEEE